MINIIDIRPIKKKDNSSIANIIKSTLEEFDAAIEGTAYTDKETTAMFEAYENKDSIYYVALLNNEIVAGCGIHKLKNDKSNICEVAKNVYITKSKRVKNR